MEAEPVWPELPPEDPVSFHLESVTFPLPDTRRLTQWIRAVIEAEGAQLVRLELILCSDKFLHQLNIDYLQHDTLTDVITFPFQAPPKVEGEIYLSIDRIRDNARQLDLAEEEEFLRVLIHGVLHLCGYGDKSSAEKTKMTAKEDEALDLWCQFRAS